jgi:hypothetical protein
LPEEVVSTTFRLIKHLAFLETESQDFDLFRTVSHHEYDVDNKKLADFTPEEWTRLKDAMK